MVGPGSKSISVSGLVLLDSFLPRGITRNCVFNQVVSENLNLGCCEFSWSGVFGDFRLKMRVKFCAGGDGAEGRKERVDHASRGKRFFCFCFVLLTIGRFPESDRILTERCHGLCVSCRGRLITWTLRYLIHVRGPR